MRAEPRALWTLLEALDDPDYIETPAGFDRAAARRAFVELTERLSGAFEAECAADLHVQDASLHAQVVVPAEATATGQSFVVRVSNFGMLAVIALDNPGVHSEEEFRARADPHDVERIAACLDAGGYVLVPEEPLWTPYRGAIVRHVFGGGGPTWWDRYFDYL